ncbi:hypothetical protein BDZ89DRAFT_1043514 [Hymenopellis radicata]|nr:hypothetical protein BDZ89DRAFT_1043514 [Hymenopellis radicata]
MIARLLDGLILQQRQVSLNLIWDVWVGQERVRGTQREIGVEVECLGYDGHGIDVVGHGIPVGQGKRWGDGGQQGLLGAGDQEVDSMLERKGLRGIGKSAGEQWCGRPKEENRWRVHNGPSKSVGWRKDMQTRSGLRNRGWDELAHNDAFTSLEPSYRQCHVGSRQVRDEEKFMSTKSEENSRVEVVETDIEDMIMDGQKCTPACRFHVCHTAASTGRFGNAKDLV